MKWTLRILLAAVTLVILFYASLFAFAEFLTEVVVLRTQPAQMTDAPGPPDAAGGRVRETRVTVIEIEGKPWVRGRPYRAWFRRVEANPNIELYRDGAWHPVRASISRDPADAETFEDAMRAKYGMLYRALDFGARMSANEIPVRLDPRAPAP